MRNFLAVTTASLATLGGLAVTADAASAKTYKFFSQNTSSRIYDASGKPVTDRSAPPVPGDVVVTSNNDYLGNHKSHAKEIYATDHLVCTFLTVDTTNFTFTALCDGEIALPGGMLLANRQKVSFKDKTVVALNGGTGKYTSLKHGKVTSVNYSDKSDNSDLTITL